jgi:hypothetical protein
VSAPQAAVIWMTNVWQVLAPGCEIRHGNTGSSGIAVVSCTVQIGKEAAFTQASFVITVADDPSGGRRANIILNRTTDMHVFGRRESPSRLAEMLGNIVTMTPYRNSEVQYARLIMILRDQRPTPRISSSQESRCGPLEPGPAGHRAQ